MWNSVEVIAVAFLSGAAFAVLMHLPDLLEAVIERIRPRNPKDDD
ncbi:hypothetical protein [Saccharopolyspora taberi]|uniref:Uncharacterized protein n=1 Tax=Saccharopolyspora taberi TaxID=60895 RepID=A0ABN3VI67_9PSEU